MATGMYPPVAIVNFFYQDAKNTKGKTIPNIQRPPLAGNRNDQFPLISPSAPAGFNALNPAKTHNVAYEKSKSILKQQCCIMPHTGRITNRAISQRILFNISSISQEATSPLF